MLRSMDAYKFFFDDKRHLRSAWRLCLFVVAFYICAELGQVLLVGALGLALHRPVTELATSDWSFVAGHGAILISAALVGWACGRLFEELPFRALGCSLRPGWLKDFGLGSALGAASLMLAALLAAATRGVHFSLDPVSAGSIGKTLVISALVFMFAAAAEEMLFRGYSLQTLTRANLAWLGVFLTSVPFAAAHLYNPHVVPGLTFLNTALAGVWLASAYLRTRRLWFPLGLHWSWNWAQASLLGLPVSGINRIAPAPLLHAMNNGPVWLTGGAYGIEGGAACTVALLVSTAVIWRWKLISPANVTNSKVHGETVAQLSQADSK
ncbi:MAG TPA: CPBP family intramembrane glutamic endopeptidase [Pyrinomonadaceae bacterium]|nr:CPBP family intramembrane glutamic endopeptidase [Pyrinomonadaceae bacterium]